jgi:hypothetical protein
MSSRNVTMIDDLPYLEDLERESYTNGVPPSELKQIQKFIRNTAYNPPHESGMAPNSHAHTQQQHHHHQHRTYGPQQQLQPQPQQMAAMIDEDADITLPPIPAPPQQNHHHQHRILSLSCIDVAEHTASCIVCSRLYNTDTTLYIIVICILLLFSAILFKKVLDLQQRA